MTEKLTLLLPVKPLKVHPRQLVYIPLRHYLQFTIYHFLYTSGIYCRWEIQT
jgi:hypothetical protein